MNQRSYVGAAFNARPFGMPIPPNWFGIAAFALLGALVSPGLWFIGLGLEGLYLWAVSTNQRFRNAVDAGDGTKTRTDWNARYIALATNLDNESREHQARIEQQAAEIVGLLSRSGANEAQMSDVRQMAWLHLKLLAARASFIQVIASVGREHKALDEQEQRIRARLDRGDCDDDLKRSLHQQLEVIQSRRTAHADAERRRELVEAELERLRQQVSLVREQALLATDENSAAQSLNAVSASLNEANRWLKEQRELFAGLDDLTDEAPPADLLMPKMGGTRGRQRVAE
jgi:hypothetical protein